MKYAVKISVLKREYYQDLADRFLVNTQQATWAIRTRLLFRSQIVN